MGIDLIPKNPGMEDEHFPFQNWNKIYAALRDHCRHIFSDKQLYFMYWSNGVFVEEWEATEIKRTLVALNLVTRKGDTPLDVFCDFCRDSEGFFIK